MLVELFSFSRQHLSLMNSSQHHCAPGFHAFFNYSKNHLPCYTGVGQGILENFVRGWTCPAFLVRPPRQHPQDSSPSTSFSAFCSSLVQSSAQCTTGKEWAVLLLRFPHRISKKKKKFREKADLAMVYSLAGLSSESVDLHTPKRSFKCSFFSCCAGGRRSSMVATAQPEPTLKPVRWWCRTRATKRLAWLASA